MGESTRYTPPITESAAQRHCGIRAETTDVTQRPHQAHDGPSSFGPARWIVVAAGSYAIVAAIVTLTGWATGIRRLTDWGGSGISMFVNTAIAALLAGAGLLFVAVGWRRPTVVAGGLVGILGLATLAQHLGGFDFGIDTLLWYRDFGQEVALSPSRMGLPASICFSIAGAALVLTATRASARRYATVAGLVVAAVASLSLVGYLYGASGLFSIPKYTAIAMQTSSILLALGVGVVAANPRIEPMRMLQGNSAASGLFRKVLPVVILLPVVAGWILLSGERALLYDTAFGKALRTIIEVSLLVGILWWAAKAVRVHEARTRQSADQLAGTLRDMSGLLERVRTSERRLAAELETARRLQAVSTRLVGPGAAAELYDEIMDAVVSVMESQFATLQIVGEGPDHQGELRLIAFRGFTPEAARNWEWVAPGAGCVGGLALTSGQRMIIRDLRECSEIRASGGLESFLANGILAVQTTPLRSRSGELLGMISSHWTRPHEPSPEALRALDVLARQAADLIERTRHHEELQRLVDQRSAELERSHSDLRRAERLAAMGTLAAGLGHDLANLMLPVRVRLDTLASLDARSEVRQEVEAVRNSLKYLEGLSSALRQMAANPEAPPPAGGTNLSTWCAEAEAIFRSMLPEGTRLECDIMAGIAPVNASAGLLTQAAFNLVQNAAEALAQRPPGAAPGLIRITAAPSASRAGWVMLSISDNGPGMTPEVAARCFEPYFSTKGRAISTGMGLALVRGMVTNTGGTIDCAATLGRGTVFTLHLPPISRESTPTHRALRAVIDVGEPRSAAVARVLLRAFAIETRPGDGTVPADAELWITDCVPHDDIEAFLTSGAAQARGHTLAGAQAEAEAPTECDGGDRRERRAVVLGCGPDRTAGGGGSIHYTGENPTSGDVRAAIERAVRGPITREP